MGKHSQKDCAALSFDSSLPNSQQQWYLAVRYVQKQIRCVGPSHTLVLHEPKNTKDHRDQRENISKEKSNSESSLTSLVRYMWPSIHPRRTPANYKIISRTIAKCWRNVP